jgi:hypothetical protein
VRDIRRKQPEKFAVAEHNINTGLCVDCNGTSVLDRAAGYMDHLIKEAVKIQLNTRNINRDGSFILSQAWYPVTNVLPDQKAGPERVSTCLCPTFPYWLAYSHKHDPGRYMYDTDSIPLRTRAEMVLKAFFAF